MAKAFGADYARITTVGDLGRAIARADGLTDRPILFDVILDPSDLPGNLRKTIPAQPPSSVRGDFDFPVMPRHVERFAT